MKSILLTLLAPGASLHASAPSGKSQSLTSQDQVPEGLVKSDWHNIRAAYEAGRLERNPKDPWKGIAR